LSGDVGSQGRVELLRERLEAIAGLAAGVDMAIEPASERSPDAIVHSEPAPQRESLEWVAVRSSNLVAVAYEPSALRLHIEFRSGSRYIYSAVPATIHRALLSSGSKGSFFSHYPSGAGTDSSGCADDGCLERPRRECPLATDPAP
jgi:hypothetical protein